MANGVREVRVGNGVLDIEVPILTQFARYNARGSFIDKQALVVKWYNASLPLHKLDAAGVRFSVNAIIFCPRPTAART